MINFLGDVLAQRVPAVVHGVQHDFCWEWLAEGVLSFTPKQAYEKAVVLSAGVHGNETAPIELLAQLSQDLFAGALELKVKLLLILGNPIAIRTGQRYVENDMNRMFCGAYQQFTDTVEAQRVAVLEQTVTAFLMIVQLKCDAIIMICTLRFAHLCCRLLPYFLIKPMTMMR